VRKGSAAIAGLERTIDGLVAEVQARGPPKAGDMSIAAHLLRLKDPATGRPLDRDRLAREFQVFFIAGSETTGAPDQALLLPPRGRARLHRCTCVVTAEGLLVDSA
jgi:hypothetical protein